MNSTAYRDVLADAGLLPVALSVVICPKSGCTPAAEISRTRNPTISPLTVREVLNNPNVIHRQSFRKGRDRPGPIPAEATNCGEDAAPEGVTGLVVERDNLGRAQIEQARDYSGEVRCHGHAKRNITVPLVKVETTDPSERREEAARNKEYKNSEDVSLHGLGRAFGLPLNLAKRLIKQFSVFGGAAAFRLIPKAINRLQRDTGQLRNERGADTCQAFPEFFSCQHIAIVRQR